MGVGRGKTVCLGHSLALWERDRVSATLFTFCHEEVQGLKMISCFYIKSVNA